MTEEEIIEIARHADREWDCDRDMFEWLETFAKLLAEKEREKIKQEFWLCLQSDLENGVKSLNDKAFKNFAKTMPELNKFGDWLESRGQE